MLCGVSDIEFSNSLELKYPDNNFSVNFTSLSYSNQHHIRYRYKLEGYDSEWRYIEAVSYTHLDVYKRQLRNIEISIYVYATG